MIITKNEVYIKTFGVTYIDIPFGSVFYFKDDEDKNVCMKLDTNSYVDLSTGSTYQPTRAETVSYVYVYKTPELRVEEYIDESL